VSLRPRPGPRSGTRKEVLVSLLDGTQVRGWVENFNPETRSIRLFKNADVRETASSRISLTDVKRISFLAAPGERTGSLGFPPNARLLTIRFADGEIFHGVTDGTSGTRSGMFLVPTNSQWYTRVFVPTEAVGEVTAVRRLGEILKADGLITRDDLDRALERQERLRREKLGHILLRRQDITREQLERGLAMQREMPAKRIGEILLEQGFITPVDLKEAIEEQRRQRNKRLGEILVEMGVATYKMIAIALAIQYNIPFIDLGAQILNPDLRDLVPEELARRRHVVPLSLQQNVLTVAVADPTHLDPIEEIRVKTGLIVIQVVALEREIDRAIDQLYGAPGDGAGT